MAKHKKIEIERPPVKEESLTLISTENPVILDQVEYVYSSYAQIMVTNMDVRIAFGDRRPPKGDVKPIVGIVMCHDIAKALLKILTANISKIDSLVEKVKQTEES